MIRIIGKQKRTTNSLLELSWQFNKVAGYKINTQNSTPFLYIRLKGLLRKYLKPITYITTDIYSAAAAAAKSLQSCPTLCDPMDCSLQSFSVPGILQARTLEWVAISFSNAWKWKVKVKPLSRVRLLATPWTAAYQAPPSMGFSGQPYWSGVPLPSPIYSATIWQLSHHLYNWDISRHVHSMWLHSLAKNVWVGKDTNSNWARDSARDLQDPISDSSWKGDAISSTAKGQPHTQWSKKNGQTPGGKG